MTGHDATCVSVVDPSRENVELSPAKMHAHEHMGAGCHEQSDRSQRLKKLLVLGGTAALFAMVGMLGLVDKHNVADTQGAAAVAAAEAVQAVAGRSLSKVQAAAGRSLSESSHNDGYVAPVDPAPAAADGIMCAIGCQSWHCGSKTTLELYVDGDVGSSGNDGCAPHKPTNSLWQVWNKAKKIVERGGKPLIHMSGNLVRSSNFDKSLTLDYRVSGSTWRGSPGATLRGNKLVEGWAAVPSGDAVFTKLVAGEAALQGKLFVADLSSFGDLGSLTRVGYPETKFPTQRPPLELLKNGQRLTRARYPKASMRQARIRGKNSGDKNSIEFKPHEHERIATWSESIGSAWGVWLDGVIGNNWEHTYNKVASYAAGTGMITLEYPQNSDMVWKNQYDPEKPLSSSNDCCYNFFYFDNVFEEISEPGEYYIDVAAKKAYVMTDGSGPPTDVYATMLEMPVIKLQVRDGQAPSGITFENIIVEGGRDHGIDAAVATDFTLRNVEVRGFGMDGVRLGENSRVDSCDIHAIGRHGVYASAGDYETLERGNAVVWNSHIHHYAEWQRVYAAAVRAVGVGNSILHNKIDNSPHVGLLVTGNDNTVAYNDISQTGLVYVDMGAIYFNSGNYPFRRGNVVDNNHIHDLGSEDKPLQVGVYPDSSTMGVTITNNLFAFIPWSGSYAIMGNGFSHVHTSNNVFFNIKVPYRLSNWLAWWGSSRLGEFQAAWNAAYASAPEAQLQLVNTRYPETAQDIFFAEDRVSPKTNTFQNALIYNSPMWPLEATVKQGYTSSAATYGYRCDNCLGSESCWCQSDITTSSIYITQDTMFDMVDAVDWQEIHIWRNARLHTSGFFVCDPGYEKKGTWCEPV